MKTKKYEVTTTKEVWVTYQDEGKLEETLKSYQDIIDHNGNKEGMLKHVATNFAIWEDSFIEGIGETSKYYEGQENHSGIFVEVISEDTECEEE
jgi:hypothetical protein